MSPSLDQPDLSAAEWTFIQNLRALPDEALRTRIHASLNKRAGAKNGRLRSESRRCGVALNLSNAACRKRATASTSSCTGPGCRSFCAVCPDGACP